MSLFEFRMPYIPGLYLYIYRPNRWHLAFIFSWRIIFFVISLQPVTLGVVSIMYYNDFCTLGIAFI